MGWGGTQPASGQLPVAELLCTRTDTPGTLGGVSQPGKVPTCHWLPKEELAHVVVSSEVSTAAQAPGWLVGNVHFLMTGTGCFYKGVILTP